jgi:cobalt-zinc-cadmium efflux system protein
MGSGHNHPPHSHLDSEKNLAFAFVLNLAFAILEFFGGLYVGSVSVLSNALHDAGDAMSIGVGLFLQRKSEKGPTEKFSYGLRRLSLLSAAISGIVICAGAAFIVFESISKLSNPGEPQAKGMMILAIVGISMNAFAAWRLGHGSTHNEKILTWHLIEDMMGWAAVFIGGVCILLFDLRWIDAALAIGISCFVIYNVAKHLKQTISLFLQGNPDPESLRVFRDTILKIDNVVNLHDLHFWSLDGAHHVLSMHVVTSLPMPRAHELKNAIRAESHRLGECHLTIEVEAINEHCHDNCDELPNKHEHHHK